MTEKSCFQHERQSHRAKREWDGKNDKPKYHITLLLFSFFSPASVESQANIRDFDFFSSLSRCQLLSIYRIDTCVCLTGSNPHAINSNTNKSINMQEVFSISLSLSCMFFFLNFVRWMRRGRQNRIEIHILAYWTSKILMFLLIPIAWITHLVSKRQFITFSVMTQTFKKSFHNIE